MLHGISITPVLLAIVQDIIYVLKLLLHCRVIRFHGSRHLNQSGIPPTPDVVHKPNLISKSHATALFLDVPYSFCQLQPCYLLPLPRQLSANTTITNCCMSLTQSQLAVATLDNDPTDSGKTHTFAAG